MPPTKPARQITYWVIDIRTGRVHTATCLLKTAQLRRKEIDHDDVVIAKRLTGV